MCLASLSSEGNYVRLFSDRLRIHDRHIPFSLVDLVSAARQAARVLCEPPSMPMRIAGMRSGVLRRGRPPVTLGPLDRVCAQRIESGNQFSYKTKSSECP